MKLKGDRIGTAVLAGLLLTALASCSAPGELQPAASSVPGSSENQTSDGLFIGLDTVDMDGNAVDRSVFGENTLTLVNVWNLACNPCIEEMPILDRLSQDYAERGVAVMGLYYSRKPELSEKGRVEVKELLEKKEIGYPHLQPNQRMMDSQELHDLIATPTTYFVDAEGNIVRTEIGTREYDEWSALIRDTLAEMGVMKAPVGLFTEMETRDLDGNVADNSLFGENTLTLVNVWELDCVACIDEMPALDQLNQDYADKGVTVKGLCLNLDKAPGFKDVTREEIRALMKKKDVNYQQLAFSQDMLDAPEIQDLLGFPTTYFVDAKGDIIQTELGTRDYNEWRELVDSALEELSK